MTKPWEKLPKESSRAFAAFHTYLGLGSERSIEAAGKKVGKCSKVLERWSKKFGWTDRARDYDAHLVRVEEEAKEVQLRAKAVDWAKRQEELKEAEWELSKAVIGRLRDFLKKPDIRISFRDAVYALELASKVGRLAAGLATEVKEQPIEIGPVIQIDIEAALERAYGALPVGRIEQSEAGGGPSGAALPEGCSRS